jgi:hypothetical protein
MNLMDCYRRLGVPASAGTPEIKAAYRPAHQPQVHQPQALPTLQPLAHHHLQPRRPKRQQSLPSQNLSQHLNPCLSRRGSPKLIPKLILKLPPSPSLPPLHPLALLLPNPHLKPHGYPLPKQLPNQDGPPLTVRPAHPALQPNHPSRTLSGNSNNPPISNSRIYCASNDLPKPQP